MKDAASTLTFNIFELVVMTEPSNVELSPQSSQVQYTVSEKFEANLDVHNVAPRPDVTWSMDCEVVLQTKAIRRFVITEKAPTMAFSWLKRDTTAFTFKTLLRHYAKRALTPRSLNVKFGPQRIDHKGRADGVG